MGSTASLYSEGTAARAITYQVFSSTNGLWQQFIEAYEARQQLNRWKDTGTLASETNALKEKLDTRLKTLRLLIEQALDTKTVHSIDMRTGGQRSTWHHGDFTGAVHADDDDGYEEDDEEEYHPDPQW
jgi:hypothetical protein